MGIVPSKRSFLFAGAAAVVLVVLLVPLLLVLAGVLFAAGMSAF
jgi:hypothetical protein